MPSQPTMFACTGDLVNHHTINKMKGLDLMSSRRLHQLSRVIRSFCDYKTALYDRRKDDRHQSKDLLAILLLSTLFVDLLPAPTSCFRGILS